MKTSKTTSLKSDFKSRTNKEEKAELIDAMVHPRIQIKTSTTFGSKKVSNSLLIQMYSQENEVLFI